MLRFEKVPPRAADLAELIALAGAQERSVPVDQAQLAYVPGAQVPDGREFVVTLARRDIIAEYEAVCDDAGVQAGVVDLATFNLVNAVVAAGGSMQGDALLVNLAPDYLAVVILRDGQLMFYRHRGSESDGSLADVVHQTAMYYEDRLGAGASRAPSSPAPAAAPRRSVPTPTGRISRTRGGGSRRASGRAWR